MPSDSFYRKKSFQIVKNAKRLKIIDNKEAEDMTESIISASDSESLKMWQRVCHYVGEKFGDM